MDPLVAQGAPVRTGDEVGARWWCACGRSAEQPYCDGNHRCTGIHPVRVEAAAPRSAWKGGTKPALELPRRDEARGGL